MRSQFVEKEQEIRQKATYVVTAGSVKKTQSLMHRLNIVQLSLKSRSRSVRVDGSGQGESHQIWSVISIEALVFEKQS